MADPEQSLSESGYSFDTGHLRADIKGRAVRSSAVTVLSSAASFLIQMVGTIVLARLLTPADFGLVTMVTTFSLLLQSVGFNGFPEAIIQRPSLDQVTVSTLFWLNGGINLVFTLLFVAAAPLVARFYNEPRLFWLTIFLSTTIIGAGLSTIHLALLKRTMRFTAVAVLNMGSRLVTMVISIALAWMGWKYWALAVSSLVGTVALTIGAWIYCRWRPGPLRKRTNVTSFVKFAAHTYGNFTLNYSCRNLDNLLVGKFIGLQPLGYYKKAYDLFALSANQLTSPLANVALAALSRFSDDHERFRQYYLNAVSMIAFLSMASGLVLTVAAKDIILLILGPQWMPSAQIFMFFGPGIGIMLVYTTHGWLHLSLGRADRWFRWGILEFVVTASLFIIGLKYGAPGVAVAWTVSFYVLTGPGLWYAGRPARLRISSVVGVIWRYFAAALGAGALTWFLLYRFAPGVRLYGRIPVFGRIVAASGLSILAYVGMTILLYMSLKPLTQAASLVRTMLPGVFGKRAG